MVKIPRFLRGYFEMVLYFIDIIGFYVWY